MGEGRETGMIVDGELRKREGPGENKEEIHISSQQMQSPMRQEATYLPASFRYQKNHKSNGTTTGELPLSTTNVFLTVLPKVTISTS